MSIKGKRVGLYTLGCKVSSYETEAVSEKFETRGCVIGSFDEPCDIYVINTCTVTAEGDAKSRKYIRRAVRQNPDAVVCVIGCYSQRAPREVAAIEGVSVVYGTLDKLSIVDEVERIFEARDVGNCDTSPVVSVGTLDGACFEKMRISRAPRTRGYVKIEDGCDSKCSYCAIAPARGRVRSKPPCEVVSEVEGLYENGTREVVLTGIEVASYGTDLSPKTSLAELISTLDERCSCDRIRLGSMAPELMTDELIRTYAASKICVPHFHISMQSGSDRVLRGMRRRYNRAMADEAIKLVRELMPRVMLTADLMVGFPGESEEDFLETMDFVRKSRLLSAHVFAYSRREGTPAADYPDQIPEEVKKERSRRLIELCQRVGAIELDSVVSLGEPLSCVLETRDGTLWSAHSDSYIEALCDGEGYSSGDAVLVKPVRHENGVLYGEIITKVYK